MKVLLILSLFTVVGCSSKKKQTPAESDGVDIAKSEEAEDADFIVDDDDKELIADDDSEEAALEEDPSIEVAASAPEVETSGEMSQYTVSKGETMMMIAFKVYGDYRVWKKISDANPGVSVNGLRAGTVLSYPTPTALFDWSPVGNPYLVRNGDTLGLISKDKYGTSNRWKDIWNNNKPLIVDPNLIFAGFTIYYKSDRDVASE